jgi:hypothetical protein
MGRIANGIGSAVANEVVSGCWIENDAACRRRDPSRAVHAARIALGIFGSFARELCHASLAHVVVGNFLRCARLSLSASLLFAASCSAVIDPDVRGLGAPPLACKPNTVAACACFGGTSSTQRCNEGGSYDACQCPLGAAGQGE